MKLELEMYSWVACGRQRKAVMLGMDRDDMIPTDIYKAAKKVNPKMSLNTTSDILKEFREKKIAVCLNPIAKVGRLYRLTKLGKALRKRLVNRP